MATPGSRVQPVPVVVGFAPPERQSRVTVGFRLILAVPHLLFLVVLAIVSYLATILAWFAALVLGRVPEGMFGFLAGVVRYTTRLYAYSLLLTDRYPPFDLNAEDYPISVELTPSRLNRLAVLFRLLLTLPAYLLLAVLSAGLSVAAFFIWLIVLITARMPRSLFEAVVAALRYETRYYAYLALLTPAYPGGLFGDRLGPEPAALWPPPTTGQFEGGPAAFAPEPGTPWEDAGVPGSAALASEPGTSPEGAGLPGSGAGPPRATPATPPRATRLVLSKAGRRVVILFIVLGALYYSSSVTLAAVSVGTAVNRQTAISTVDDSYGTLISAVRGHQTEIKGCGGASDHLRCIQSADGRLATAFLEFSVQVSNTRFPSSSRASARQLESVSGEMASLLDQLATAPNATEYRARFAEYQSTGSRFDGTYRQLRASLA
ncbi:MAG TPA: DUF4389 domain-containing protein [Acidimicrobiales bacterium]|nr:DUF4389 domain-containing protein [Acidimicrobiales bacterium]